jgi:ABC-type enterobactin transport system permease subunit
MKILTTSLVLLSVLATGCTSFPRANTEEAYVAGAVADTVATEIALNQPNLAEANPLGFAGATAFKGAMYYYAKQNPEQAEEVYRLGSSAFTGAAVNNILLVVGAASGVSILAGILTGLFIYNSEVEQE